MRVYDSYAGRIVYVLEKAASFHHLRDLQEELLLITDVPVTQQILISSDGDLLEPGFNLKSFNGDIYLFDRRILKNEMKFPCLELEISEVDPLDLSSDGIGSSGMKSIPVDIIFTYASLLSQVSNEHYEKAKDLLNHLEIYHSALESINLYFHKYANQMLDRYEKFSKGMYTIENHCNSWIMQFPSSYELVKLMPVCRDVGIFDKEMKTISDFYDLSEMKRLHGKCQTEGKKISEHMNGLKVKITAIQLDLRKDLTENFRLGLDDRRLQLDEANKMLGTIEILMLNIEEDLKERLSISKQSITRNHTLKELLLVEQKLKNLLLDFLKAREAFLEKFHGQLEDLDEQQSRIFSVMKELEVSSNLFQVKIMAEATTGSTNSLKAGMTVNPLSTEILPIVEAPITAPNSLTSAATGKTPTGAGSIPSYLTWAKDLAGFIQWPTNYLIGLLESLRRREFTRLFNLKMDQLYSVSDILIEREVKQRARFRSAIAAYFPPNYVGKEKFHSKSLNNDQSEGEQDSKYNKEDGQKEKENDIYISDVIQLLDENAAFPKLKEVEQNKIWMPNSSDPFSVDTMRKYYKQLSEVKCSSGEAKIKLKKCLATMEKVLQYIGNMSRELSNTLVTNLSSSASLSSTSIKEKSGSGLFRSKTSSTGGLHRNSVKGISSGSLALPSGGNIAANASAGEYMQDGIEAITTTPGSEAATIRPNKADVSQNVLSAEGELAYQERIAHLEELLYKSYGALRKALLADAHPKSAMATTASMNSKPTNTGNATPTSATVSLIHSMIDEDEDEIFQTDEDLPLDQPPMVLLGNASTEDNSKSREGVLRMDKKELHISKQKAIEKKDLGIAKNTDYAEDAMIEDDEGTMFQENISQDSDTTETLAHTVAEIRKMSTEMNISISKPQDIAKQLNRITGNTCPIKSERISPKAIQDHSEGFETSTPSSLPRKLDEVINGEPGINSNISKRLDGGNNSSAISGTSANLVLNIAKHDTIENSNTATIRSSMDDSVAPTSVPLPINISADKVITSAASTSMSTTPNDVALITYLGQSNLGRTTSAVANVGGVAINSLVKAPAETNPNISPSSHLSTIPLPEPSQMPTIHLPNQKNNQYLASLNSSSMVEQSAKDSTSVFSTSPSLSASTTGLPLERQLQQQSNQPGSVLPIDFSHQYHLPPSVKSSYPSSLYIEGSTEDGDSSCQPSLLFKNQPLLFSLQTQPPLLSISDQPYQNASMFTFSQLYDRSSLLESQNKELKIIIQSLSEKLSRLKNRDQPISRPPLKSPVPPRSTLFGPDAPSKICSSCGTSLPSSFPPINAGSYPSSSSSFIKYPVNQKIPPNSSGAKISLLDWKSIKDGLLKKTPWRSPEKWNDFLVCLFTQPTSSMSETWKRFELGEFKSDLFLPLRRFIETVQNKISISNFQIGDHVLFLPVEVVPPSSSKQGPQEFEKLDAQNLTNEKDLVKNSKFEDIQTALSNTNIGSAIDKNGHALNNSPKEKSSISTEVQILWAPFAPAPLQEESSSQRLLLMHPKDAQQYNLKPVPDRANSSVTFAENLDSSPTTTSDLATTVDWVIAEIIGIQEFTKSDWISSSSWSHQNLDISASACSSKSLNSIGSTHGSSKGKSEKNNLLQFSLDGLPDPYINESFIRSLPTNENLRIRLLRVRELFRSCQSSY